MNRYILKRLLLVLPTLVGIITLNFFIVQLAPGGPVDQTIARLTSQDVSATTRIGSSSTTASANTSAQSQYIGGQGLDPALIEAIKKQYGFDRPVHERYFKMLRDYFTLDFGNSYYQGRPVIELIMERMPVSISLGLWSLLLIYFISIPLGISKALRDGSHFDVWSSALIFIGYSIPSFLFAIILLVVFAGGAYFDWFPLRGLISRDFDSLSLAGKLADYFWHMVLPVTAIAIGGFATLTMLTKNSFLDEISKHYVITARAKGMTERSVLYGHVFRNAMLIVIASFPVALVGILFTSTLLIEVIFSLRGLGLLGFEATLTRDYPIVFGTVFCFTFLHLLLTLVGDITYTLVDPRIDFDSRDT